MDDTNTIDNILYSHNTSLKMMIDCYHACETKGGNVSVRLNAPFKGRGVHQWLGNGYYFWTDSVGYATDWGVKSVNPTDSDFYAIVRCIVVIDRSSLLDLVGSVQDQEIFVELIKLFVEKHKQSKNKKVPTVRTVIDYFKSEQNFPYKAIRACDGKNKGTIKFVSNRDEELSLVTRQQLCLFDKNLIQKKEIVYFKQ